MNRFAPIVCPSFVSEAAQAKFELLQLADRAALGAAIKPENCSPTSGVWRCVA